MELTLTLLLKLCRFLERMRLMLSISSGRRGLLWGRDSGVRGLPWEQCSTLREREGGNGANRLSIKELMGISH